MPREFDYDAGIATMIGLQNTWVTGVIMNLNEEQQKLPLSDFREVAASMMKFLSLEQISMENMIASTRFEFHRFMAYFSQERRQSVLCQM